MNIEYLKKSIKSTAQGTLLAIIIVIPLFYLWVHNSGAYAHAVSIIQSSPEIKEKIGEIKEISISPFTTQVPYAKGDSGWAKITFLVKTNKTKATIRAIMKKQEGIWSLEKYIITK